MKNVKDVLNAYEESPSADVWKRLNARLEEEMPATGKVYRIHRATAWKWTAAVLAALIIGGAVTVGVFLHNRGNQDVIAENNKKSIDSQEIEMIEAVTEPVEIVELENVPDAEEANQTLQPRNVVDNEVVKPTEKPDEQEEAVATKTNARQIVLPPNSTLAKQLAVDPVLKNLSDESVDWSLPVHFSIPNLFTPNNDGVNDFFVIEGLENYSSSRLVVRDKNNKVVYQNDAYKNTWGGENCPDGVYSYEFVFKYEGIENQATGKVRIIRS